jgi:hypothetical protein
MATAPDGQYRVNVLYALYARLPPGLQVPDDRFCPHDYMRPILIKDC